MAVLIDSIKRVELLTALPYVLENIDRFSTMLGSELTANLREHNVLMSSFNELKEKARELMEIEAEKAAAAEASEDGGSAKVSQQTKCTQVRSVCI